MYNSRTYFNFIRTQLGKAKRLADKQAKSGEDGKLHDELNSELELLMSLVKDYRTSLSPPAPRRMLTEEEFAKKEQELRDEGLL